MDLTLMLPTDPRECRDGDLQLELTSFAPHLVHKVPTYHFRMVHAATAEELGSIRLRVVPRRKKSLTALVCGKEVQIAFEAFKMFQYSQSRPIRCSTISTPCGRCTPRFT